MSGVVEEQKVRSCRGTGGQEQQRNMRPRAAEEQEVRSSRGKQGHV